MEDTDGIRALQAEQVRQDSQLRPCAGGRIKADRTELVWCAVQIEDYLIDFNDLAGARAVFNVVVFKVVNLTGDWKGSLWFTDAARGSPSKASR